MAEFHGYKAEDEVVSRLELYQLSDMQKGFFDTMEGTIINRPIRVRLVVGNVMGRLVEDINFPGVVIYDAATPEMNPDEAEPSAIGEVAFTSKKMQLNKYDIWYRQPAETHRSVPFTRNKVGGANTRTLGTVFSRLIYSAIPISNYESEEFLLEAFEKPLEAATNASFWAIRKSNHEKEVKEQFVEEVERQMMSDIQNLESRNQDSLRDIAQYNSSIKNLYSEIRRNQREKEMKRQYLGGDKEKAREVIKALCSNTMVESITADTPYDIDISIYTKPVYLYSPNRNERVILGSMRIDISYGDRIKIHNLNNSKRTRPHPHIDESGAPCWGASNQAINELMSDRDYVALLEVILAYLEQYNPHDAYGEYGKYWFETEELEIRQNDGTYMSAKEIEARLAQLPSQNAPIEGEVETEEENGLLVEVQDGRVTRILGRVGEEEEV